jgi:hypothetical protein
MRPLRSTVDLLGFACIGRIRRIRRIPWDSAPPVGSPVSPHASAKTLRFGWIWSDFLGFTRICLDLVELPGAVQFPRLTSRPNQNTPVWSDLVGFGRISLDLVELHEPCSPFVSPRLHQNTAVWSDLVGFGWISLDSSFAANEETDDERQWA